MKKLNQKGFGVVEGLLIFVALAIVAGTGFYVYNKVKNDQTGKPSGDTTQKINKENKAETKSQKSDPNSDHLVVKEWGIRFKVPGGLTDVKYTIHDDTASFFAKPVGSNVEYRDDYDKFEEGNSQYALGELYRSKESTNDERVDDTLIKGKKVGNYYYYTAWSFSGLASGAACVGLYGDASDSCAQEAKAFKLINQGDNALLNTIELAQ